MIAPEAERVETESAEKLQPIIASGRSGDEIPGAREDALKAGG